MQFTVTHQWRHIEECAQALAVMSDNKEKAKAQGAEESVIAKKTMKVLGAVINIGLKQLDPLPLPPQSESDMYVVASAALSALRYPRRMGTHHEERSPPLE